MTDFAAIDFETANRSTASARRIPRMMLRFSLSFGKRSNR